GLYRAVPNNGVRVSARHRWARYALC
ncbi:MAG: hypothetical protein, partial [Olavius algarvensis Gamma 1 endosymbiont]